MKLIKFLPTFVKLEEFVRFASGIEEMCRRNAQDLDNFHHLVKFGMAREKGFTRVHFHQNAACKKWGNKKVIKT
jgi:hypothetical protein